MADLPQCSVVGIEESQLVSPLLCELRSELWLRKELDLCSLGAGGSIRFCVFPLGQLFWSQPEVEELSFNIPLAFA